MIRLLSLALVVVSVAASAQEGPQRGKIKRIDADKGVVTITAGDKEYEFSVTPRTRFMDGRGGAIDNGLKDERLKEGTSVMFRGSDRNGRRVLDGLRLAGDADGPDRPRDGQGGEIHRASIKKL